MAGKQACAPSYPSTPPRLSIRLPASEHPSCIHMSRTHSEKTQTNTVPFVEEIRRSGRATKGQHTKNSDDDLPPPAPARKSGQAQQKSKSKGKGGKAVSDEPEPDDSPEDDAIIRCVCGINDDDYEGTMVCCEKCLAWQHNLCMGISEDESKLPDEYWCEQCRPQDHVALLAAMKLGEKPWDVRKAEKAEAERIKRQKKGKRKSRPSAVASNPPEDTPPKQTPTPVDTGNKRKFSALEEAATKPVATQVCPVPISAIQSVATHRNNKAQPVAPSPAASATPSAANQRRKASTVANDSATKKRKSAESTPVRKESTGPPAEDISGLPKDRQKAAQALQKELKPLIEKATKDATFRIPDGETATSLAFTHALQIEQALVNAHGTPSGYGPQFRSILFNVKKNNELLHHILSGSIAPAELAEMSTDDMASEELQRQRAVIKEQADKHAILAHEESGPRIRKTHKGEELIGEDNRQTDESYSVAPVRRRTTIDDTAQNSSPPPEVGSPHQVELPDPDDLNKPALSVNTTTSNARRQSSFDMTQVWKSARSPDQPSGAFQPSRRSTGAEYDTSMVQDADVDRLLKDEDMEDAPPSSSIDAGSVAWRGTIDMAGVAGFNGAARWVAGGDIGVKIPYKDLLPSAMEISGRINIDRADEYVSNMRWSASNDVCALALTPAHTENDYQGFQAIFNYFHTKERWGVIAPEMHDAIRDVYIVTLEAGSSEYPQFLHMLADKRIEEPRTTDMLLLTIVAKTKSPPPSNAGTPQLPTSIHDGPPAVPGPNPQFSPVTSHTPYNNGIVVPPPNGSTPPYGELAVKILGPFIHTTVVRQILEAVPDMTEVQLHNLRDVLNREPATREDIGKLGEHLAQLNRDNGVVA
jgi:hypothetical protein